MLTPQKQWLTKIINPNAFKIIEMQNVSLRIS